MTDRLDRIIDIAKAYNREDARRIIEDILTESAPAPMTAKPRGQSIPITRFTKHPDGRSAIVHTVPPFLVERKPPVHSSELQQEVDEWNKVSKDIVKKTFAPGSSKPTGPGPGSSTD